MRKLVILVVAIAALSFATAATASSKSISNISFTVVPQTSIVRSGSSATIKWTITNNTLADATCAFNLTSQTGGFVGTFPLGTVYSRNSAGGQVSTPALYKNDKLTFQLICDRVDYGSQTVNIKVR